MSHENYDPINFFESKIKREMELLLKTLGFTQPIVFEYPPSNLGDFAFPCFSLAPILKKNPAEIAKQIAEKLHEIPGIQPQVSGPYLNFKIKNTELVKQVLETIYRLNKHYGEGSKKDTKIILEHTSANPTDKLHVGRARNPIIGDTLARILKCAGYNLETQYYVDDMGKQSARKILAKRYKYLKKDKTKFKTDYQWATSATTLSSDYYDFSKAQELNEILEGLESGDQQMLQEAEEVCSQMMDEVIIPSLKRINVFIDKYVNESKFMLDNSVFNIIDELKKSEYFDMEEDGACFIDLTPFDLGITKDKFFFVRADGKSLYATRDIAYHHWKFKHWDIAINILGEDHKLESEYVRLGLKLTGSDKFPESIFYAFVNLPEGRMSTRKGQVVYIDDLVDEAVRLARDEVKLRREDLNDKEIEEIAEMVGIGAVRYNIIKVQAEKKIVFRWEDALNFEGDSAPFIQYAHARGYSILRKADEMGFKVDPNNIKNELIQNDFELELLRTLARFPGLVQESSTKRAAHIIASYAHQVAAEFNQFYRECPVLKAETPELINARILLVDSTRIVLGNTLKLLGIKAPERM
jgi:arginyl-tRNA synthetase